MQALMQALHIFIIADVRSYSMSSYRVLYQLSRMLTSVDSSILPMSLNIQYDGSISSYEEFFTS